MCKENTDSIDDSEDKEKLGETIEINLSIVEQKKLVTFCVKRFFSPLSVQVFEDMLDDGHDFKDSLYQSALNEMVNILLKEHVDNNPIPDDNAEETQESS